MVGIVLRVMIIVMVMMELIMLVMVLMMVAVIVMMIVVWDFGRPSISGSIPSIKMYSWA
jgi:hypothetical protein